MMHLICTILTFVFSIFLCFAAGYGIYEATSRYFRRNRETRRHAAVRGGGKSDIKKTEHNVRSAITSIGAKIIKNEAGAESGDRSFFFKYQSECFISQIHANTGRVSIIMPGFFTCTIDELNYIRACCNSLNSTSCCASLVYQISKDENEVTVSCIATLPHSSDSIVVNSLLPKSVEDCFTLRHAFHDNFSKMKHVFPDNEMRDCEFATAEAGRLQMLLAESEIAGQGRAASVRLSPDAPYTVNRMLSIFFPSQRLKATSLTIVIEKETGHEMQELKGEAAENYELWQALIRKENERSYAFAGNFANLLLRCEPQVEYGSEAIEVPAPLFSILLQPAGGNGINGSLYFRLTMSRPALGVSTRASCQAHFRQAFIVDCMVAFDPSSPAKRLAEFKYMLDDANDKIKEGKFDQCTPEQKIISDCEFPDSRYNLYWGRRYLRERRYLEALPHFLNVWDLYSTEFANYGGAENSRFYKTAYFVGLCYLKLHLYSQACYYLEVASHRQEADYLRAYITSLLHAHDYRAEEITQGLIDQMQQKAMGLYTSDSEMPKSMMHFKNFLFRTKVKLLMKRSAYAEAKVLLLMMLIDPENADFAISQLAIVKKKLEETDKPGETTPS